MGEESSAFYRIPVDVVHIIFQRVHLLDQIRCGAVCTEWRSLAAEHHRSLQPQAPWLLFLHNNCGSPCPCGLQYFCIPDPDTGHRRLLPLRLPEPFRLWRVSGSSHGWLFAFSSRGRAALLNPITRTSIQLPDLHLTHGNVNYPAKAILSSPPTSTGCILAMFHRDQHLRRSFVEVCRPGRDTSWAYRIELRQYLTDLTICSGSYIILQTMMNDLYILILPENAGAVEPVVHMTGPILDPYSKFFPSHLVDGDDGAVSFPAAESIGEAEEGKTAVAMMRYRGLLPSKKKEILMVLMKTPMWEKLDWSMPESWSIDKRGKYAFEKRHGGRSVLLGELGFAERVHLGDQDGDFILWRDSIHDCRSKSDSFEWKVFESDGGKLLKKIDIVLPGRCEVWRKGTTAVTWFTPDFGSTSLNDEFGRALSII